MALSLIGYRGSGKSAVAREMAVLLEWEWRDADAVLEARAGRTIAEVFAAEGEAGFRDRESAVLVEMLQHERSVLALGGGVVIRPENRALLKKHGNLTVWLTAPAEELTARIAADEATAARRPPLTALGNLAEIRVLLVQREPWYRECAALMVETSSKSPGRIAAEIVEYLRANKLA